MNNINWKVSTPKSMELWSLDGTVNGIKLFRLYYIEILGVGFLENVLSGKVFRVGSSAAMLRGKRIAENIYTIENILIYDNEQI